MTATAGEAVTEKVRDEKPKVPRKDRPGEGNETRRAAFFITPTLMLLAVVILYPVVRAIYMSFRKDDILNPGADAGGAGLSNYSHWLLQQCATATGATTDCAPGTLGAQFWDSFNVTIFFTVVSVVIELVLGLWFAMIMNKAFKGRGLLRAAVLIPWAIPTAVTAKLFYFIFASKGIVNSTLGTSILWTGEKWPARFAIIISDVWKTTPFMALLILAGLQLISAEVYEAAKVDGASAWQRFLHITLPLVKPALMVAVLFRTLDVLRMYDLPAILTGGANGTSTLSILVVNDVRAGTYNSAAALSTITFVLIFTVAFLFVKLLGTNVGAENPKKGGR
ncbi:MAG: sugar ABC transporter permease [Nocardioidaceae bacterium]|nr:sugar ABC transporter permease [Nocardioidaceae bacterium]